SNLLYSAPLPTQIHTLSLHDALPISAPRASTPTPTPQPPPSGVRNAGVSALCDHPRPARSASRLGNSCISDRWGWGWMLGSARRSEEHTSELQSRENLVCRLLLEKKK